MCTDRPSTAIESASRRSSTARSDCRLPSLGICERKRVVVAGGLGEHALGGVDLARVAELQADVPAADEPFELVGGALGHEPAVVEHRDPVRELVGLLEVLRGEEDRDAAGDEVADALPHRAPAARVEPGGRLVEEDDPRVADQGHRQIEPAAHATGVGRHVLVRRLGQVEAVEQFRGPPAAFDLAEVVQIGHQDQVLLPREQVVDGRELPRDADRGAHAVGVLGQVVAGDAHRAAVGADQGREDLDDRRLARAVGAEQREDRPLGDLEIDAVEHEVLAEGLAEPGRGDRRHVTASGS